MKKFNIALSDNNVTVAKDGSYIFMPIHIESEEQSFPDNSWTDFAFPIIYQWAENLIKNINLPNSSYTLYFMDGPYCLNIKQQRNKLKLVGVNFNKQGSQFEMVCYYHEFLAEILKASRFLRRMIGIKFPSADSTEMAAILETALHYEQIIYEILKRHASAGDG